MFEITTNYTIEECNELHGQVQQYRYIASEIEAVKNGVSLLSGMEEILERMQRAMWKIGEEISVYDQMTQALDKINYFYLTNENRIVNNAEQSEIVYNRARVERIDLSRLVKKIHEEIILK